MPVWPGGHHWLSNLAIAALLENYRHRGTNRDRLPGLLKRAHGRRSKKRGTEPRRFAVVQKRSQRTEAETRFLIFSLQHVDYGYTDDEGHHMRVGVWDDDADRISRSFNLVELARATNLKRPSQRYEGKLRSSCRLDRAIRVVGRDCAAYVFRHQARPLEDGRHKGRPAQMFMTFALFDELGLRAEAERAIAEARQRRAAAAELPQESPPAPTVAQMVSGAVKELAEDHRLAGGVLERDLPQLHDLEWKIGGEHRDWSAADVRAEALRRLKPSKPPPDRR